MTDELMVLQTGVRINSGSTKVIKQIRVFILNCNKTIISIYPVERINIWQE